MTWKKVSSKVIFTHPRITLVEDTVQLPSGKQTPYLTFAAKNNSSMVICRRDGEVLLQKEYSYPPNEVLYQFPGGKVEIGETVSDGAMRELAEEAGLKTDKLQNIGWFYVDNRRTSAKMYVYVAEDCVITPKFGGDDEENISSEWIDIKQVDEMIRKGKIVNYSLLAGWALFRARTKTH